MQGGNEGVIVIDITGCRVKRHQPLVYTINISLIRERGVGRMDSGGG